MKIIRMVFVIMFLFHFMAEDAFATKEIVRTNHMYSYEDLLRDTLRLKNAFPESISLDIIGTSSFGKPIPAIKVGKGDKHVLLVGAHHGREWLTSALLMKMIDTYASTYKTNEALYGYNTNILDEVSIWFVPMLNPDGVSIQQNGLAAVPIFFKELLLEMNENDLNFKKWKSNGIGIDLNRQYPTGWMEINNHVTTNSYKFFKGTYPGEAIEVKSLMQFTKQEKPLIAVSYHSSGRILYWSYKNDKNVINRDHEIASQYALLTGYGLVKPKKNPEGGGFTDWFIQEFKRPAFTPEISYYVKETNPPLSVFPEEWERNKSAGLFIVNEAIKHQIN